MKEALRSSSGPMPAHRKHTSLKDFCQDRSDFLSCSEWLLIELMINNNPSIWPLPLPTATPPSDYETVGSLEFGVVLFLINNPWLINKPTSWSWVKCAAFDGVLLAAAQELPATNMTSAAYQALSGDKLVYTDGTVVGTNPFELYDQNWMFALYNMLETDANNNYYNSDVLPVPQDTYSPTVITSLTGQNFVTVGLVSDWGTGAKPAQQVMTTLMMANPDCLIHLGDVYYSGSPQTSSDYVQAGEELNNLVSQWPANFQGPSFTLNSNHEMYCGAQGLFVDALQANIPAKNRTTPFKTQGGFSMFALSVGDWTILGLDSAYNGTSLDFFMYGDLGQEENGDYITQIQWIKNLNLTDLSKVIVLTHHTGFDFDCSATTQSNFAPFWQQVNQALGGDPYAWYWGHVHNGIVYASPVKIPASTPFKTDTYCRCLGHGALPFGVATGLVEGQNNIVWFAHDRQPQSGGVDLVYNGCVVLGFVLQGEQVTSITEFFISTDPDPEPFVNTIYGSPGELDAAKLGLRSRNGAKAPTARMA